MKPVKNKFTTRLKETYEDPDAYWCQHCGAANSGRVNFTETGYGTAILVNLDGDLNDQEIDEYDNFEITGYCCGACGYEASSAENVFTRDNPTEVEDEEEEEEDD